MKRYTHMPADRRSAGFTLVELLVVIAIIGLLIAIALPGFRGARIAAKKTATQAVIASIEAGLQQYREERALGNTYPPSASDSARNGIYTVIKDPVESSGMDVRITGASLLLYGLAGADLQGTRGFRAVSGFNTWADAMTAGAPNGLYSVGGNNPAPTYGPFVGANLLDRVEFIGDLEKFPLGDLTDGPLSAQEEKQQVIADDFGGPILYYKARPAARRMVTNPGQEIGIYDWRDNALLTRYPGSQLANTRYFGDADFGNDGTFDGFILDRKASRRSGPNDTDPIIVDRPVNPDDCLLISAGPDLLFGTQDDVVNWTK
jgi:prepilin-type N-terminal cleavage/methylation domain-containing protein